MTKAVLAGVLAVFAMAGAARDALAQSKRPAILAGVGVGSVWDDETFLGRGPTVSGGVGLPLSDHLSVEGEVSVTGHSRQAGYLSANGTAADAVARLSYAFRPHTARMRPFASAGLGVLHTSGDLTLGSRKPSHWNMTEPALEFGGGVTIRGSGRLDVRPEVRWSSTIGTSSGPGIALPIWRPRIGVSLVWKSR